MGGFSTLSAPKPWRHHHNLSTIPNQPTTKNVPSLRFNPPPSRKPKPFSCFALDSSKPEAPPLVVVGSANADIYVEIERLPKEGETVSAKTGQTLAGGKGANQAVCGGKLDYPTYFVGQVGEDAHGKLITEALEGGGANMASWPETLQPEDLEVVKNAGIVLLQREIPDSVNIQVAKTARSAGVPVILDAGGVDAPIPPELLKFIDILSPNETELARLTNMPTESFEQISEAVGQCHKMGVKQVLVKLGAKGSVLFTEGEEPIRQPIISAPKVIDTTGAGDTFTAAFAVALVEESPKKNA
ncbi:UNVERIFIED_CONTAM: Ribokinase [Sesamum calycinum]|uniref:Ribokinase n=1 Tax=Sesamum calycinum TaxID=2727403 RepID=A0AAW2Q4A1_9LAMI